MILSFVITYIIFKVEVWLMRLLNAMVSTILHEMNESVQTYEDKPRDQNKQKNYHQNHISCQNLQTNH